MIEINALRAVESMGKALRRRSRCSRPSETLAVLRRWQLDEMLDDATREAARRITREIESLWGGLSPAGQLG
jgi:hypothetical protein